MLNARRCRAEKARYFCRTAVRTVGAWYSCMDVSFALQYSGHGMDVSVQTFGGMVFGVVLVCAIRRKYLLAALWHVPLSGRGAHRRTLRHRERPILARGHTH